jgi:hypothetical protein
VSKTTSKPKSYWISARAAERLGIPRQKLPALARAGLIRSWRLPLPGTRPKYAREDVVKLLPGAAGRGGAP